jgi:hypothetical protein
MLGKASRFGPPDLRGPRELEARAVVDTLLARVANGRAAAFDVGTAYTGLGELDLAFEWMGRAVGEQSVIFSVMHPAYDELHRDPRFAALRASMGLPPWSPPPLRNER